MFQNAKNWAAVASGAWQIGVGNLNGEIDRFISWNLEKDFQSYVEIERFFYFLSPGKKSCVFLFR